MTEYELVQKLRPKDKIYKKILNVDKNGNKIYKGVIVHFRFHGIIDKYIVLQYDNRLGWVYYDDDKKQKFIMPVNFYQSKNVQVFHLCEINTALNELLCDFIDNNANDNYTIKIKAKENES